MSIGTVAAFDESSYGIVVSFDAGGHLVVEFEIGVVFAGIVSSWKEVVCELAILWYRFCCFVWMQWQRLQHRL